MAGALPAVKSTRRRSPARRRLSRQPGLDPADPPAPAKESRAIFHGVIHKNETYDATLCNPPFHDSAESAWRGRAQAPQPRTRRRKWPQFWRSAAGAVVRRGEVAFISQMIRESRASPAVKWFTSLVSRGDNLPPLYRLLTEVGAVKVVKRRWPRGKSKVALSHGALWTTPNAVVHSNATRRPGCRRPASAAAAVCTGARTPARSKCFFTGCRGQNAPSTASAAGW